MEIEFWGREITSEKKVRNLRLSCTPVALFKTSMFYRWKRKISMLAELLPSCCSVLLTEPFLYESFDSLIQNTDSVPQAIYSIEVSNVRESNRLPHCSLNKLSMSCATLKWIEPRWWTRKAFIYIKSSLLLFTSNTQFSDLVSWKSLIDTPSTKQRNNQQIPGFTGTLAQV